MSLNDNNYWWRDLKLDDVNTSTRERLLIAAYQEMHLNGFQSTGLAQILERAGVTKGALYHHFKNKSELGHAVIDEIISDQMKVGFMQPLDTFENPIDGLIAIINGAGESFTLVDIELGCPLNNLSQEMAPVDEGFRLKLNLIYENWIVLLQQKLEQGQKDNFVNKETNCRQMAVLIVATLEGCLSAAKVSQNLERLELCGSGLIQHLNFIRA
jgi:AcrR family transcriptional regulator